MASPAILWAGLLLTTLVVSGDRAPVEVQPQILQDSKTNVIYYLESDRRHIAAISPDGKLLWYWMAASEKVNVSIHSFNFTDEGWSVAKGEKCIEVILFFGAGGSEIQFLRMKDGLVAATVVE
jgi:hypothetical protein